MKRQKKGGYCIRNGDIGDRPRSASATHSSHAMSAMLFTLYSQATALIVLGVERSLTLVEGLDGVEAVLVDGEGELHVTRGLAETLHVVRPPRR